jgi:urease accessory protein
MAATVMLDRRDTFAASGMLRLQSWLSPAFPTGAYSYSHGLEWAIEADHISDRKTLVDWLDADLRHGSGRNEAIFFITAFNGATVWDRAKIFEVAELAAAFRATKELALESTQQAEACIATLQRVWPDRLLRWLLRTLRDRNVPPAVAVALGVRTARAGIAIDLALPAFLQSYIANQVSAGVRLIPLGQTDGQIAVADLEHAVLAISAEARTRTIDDIGSAAFMVDLASMAHENQYTRLFRS